MWEYWSTRELQEEIGAQNIAFLEEVIPALSKTDASKSFIGNKQKLAGFVESLQDHNYFRHRENLEKCLFRVPQGKLSEICIAIGFDGDKNDLNALSRKITASNSNFEKLIDIFSLDLRFLSTDPLKSDAYFDSIEASLKNPKIVTKPFKSLKSYQIKCALDINEMLSPQMARAILQMPTGSGKTRTASEIIAEHLNEPGIKQVVWLANTRELCEQAIQCMKEVWDHLGRRTCRFNRIWDGNLKKIPDWTGNQCVFSVMSLQSGWSFLNNQEEYFTELFKNSSLVIVDEAHIAVAPTYSKVIRTLSQASHCKVLGLTATPGRTVREQTSILSDLFFGKICSLKDPNSKRDNAIAYLRSIGVMSQAHRTEITYSSELKLTAAEKSKLNDGQDYSDRILEKLGADSYRTVTIVEKLKNLLDQNAKIIMFAPSVQNSFLTSSILTFLGYKSVHVSGNTPSRTRDALIEKFLNGEYQIMCNYGVLATGFDAPNVDVVCIARPTQSAVLYSQMIGRGLRGQAVGGTKECLIFEVRDNFIGQDNQDGLYKQFKDYWAYDVN